MNASFSNSPRKIRVGYHWSNTDGRTDGIARYVNNSTQSGINSNVEFVNCASSKLYSIPFVGRFFFILNLLLGINIRKKEIDVYWGVAHKLPFLQVENVSYVVTIHDLVWKVCPQSMPSMRRFTERFFFPIAIRNADLIITVSQSTANDIVKHFSFCADKIKAIPLASAIGENNKSKKRKIDNTQYVLFVGTIEPRKNIKNMLGAYAALPKYLKQKYKFILVGNIGWGNIELDKLLVKFNLTSFVEWKSFVNDQELSALYQNAYCLLFPSFYEGFGLPIVEAHSFGIPAITSNISSMPEVVGEGGLLVDPCSIESIKNALERLLNDIGLRDSLSQKALINAQRFCWEKTVNTTYDVFSESMNIRGR
jgi:glycosyltransferase involved in cell wall biosynthesis